MVELVSVHDATQNICHIESCHIESCHIESCHIESCHIESCHIESCHIESCHIESCHILYNGPSTFTKIYILSVALILFLNHLLILQQT